MKKFKVLSLFLVLTLFVTMLAGCGERATDDNGDVKTITW